MQTTVDSDIDFDTCTTSTLYIWPFQMRIYFIKQIICIVPIVMYYIKKFQVTEHEIYKIILYNIIIVKVYKMFLFMKKDYVINLKANQGNFSVINSYKFEEFLWWSEEMKLYITLSLMRSSHSFISRVLGLFTEYTMA